VAALTEVLSPSLVPSSRIHLSPFTPDDFASLHLHNAYPEVMRHIGTGVRDEDETRQHLDRILHHWATYSFGIWAMFLRDSGRFAGRCGLQHYESTDEIELSYALVPDLWGRGLMLEAARASLDLGFSTLALPRIIATVRSANARSHRVLEKLGMRPAGRRERYGHLVDQFAIDRAEFRAALPT
jgi:RimJ/RimL family protein N-acetyltransferase